MELRAFKIEDHETVCKWWAAQGWPPVPMNCLSPTGLIIEGMCAGWIYKTNGCAMGVLEWIVGNPEADKTQRAAALDLLITGLEKTGKELGIEYILTFTGHQRLLDRYKKHGFKETDKNMTHLVKQVWQP